MSVISHKKMQDCFAKFELTNNGSDVIIYLLSDREVSTKKILKEILKKYLTNLKESDIILKLSHESGESETAS